MDVMQQHLQATDNPVVLLDLSSGEEHAPPWHTTGEEDEEEDSDASDSSDDDGEDEDEDEGQQSGQHPSSWLSRSTV